MRLLLCALALACCLSPLSAQSLLLNGRPGSSLIELGTPATVTLNGIAGQAALLAFNTSSGPTEIGGLTLPIGVDAGLVFLASGAPLPPSGSLSWTATFPVDPALSGVTLFGVGLLADPAAPNGLVATNGVSATLTLAGASAGPAAAGLVGRPVPLDGTGNAIGSGTSVQWIVRRAPTGGSATLEGEQDAVAALVASEPGTYEVEIQLDGPQGFRAARTEVEVYRLLAPGFAQGAFLNGPLPLQGMLEGPQPVTLEIDGQPVAVAGDGSFSAPALQPNAALDSVPFSIVGPAGGRGGFVRSASPLVGAPLSDPVAVGAFLRARNVDLSLLTAPLQGVVQNIPLGSTITSLPPLPVLQTPIASATVTFTQASYDQANASFAIIPLNGSPGLRLTLPQLVIAADVTGSLFFAPYAETATIAADPVVLEGELVISSTPNGALQLDIANPTATLQNFSLTVTGALGGLTQIGIIEDGIRTALEAALAGVLDLVPQAVNPVLAPLVPPPLDLGALGIPLLVELPLQGIGYDMDGLTLTVGVRATPSATPAGAPAVTEFLSNPAIVPGFAPTTPLLAADYDLALGLAQDAANQVLAASTAAGAFVLPSSTLPPTTAAALALALPGGGFEDLDPNTVLLLRGRPCCAPAVTLAGSASATDLELWVAGYEIDVVAPGAQGGETVLLTLAVEASVPVSIGLDPMAGTFTFTPGTPLVEAHLVQAIAGRDPTGALAFVTPLVQGLFDLVLAPLQALPLPGAGGAGGGLLVEVSTSAQTAGSLTLYVDLP